MENFAHKPLFHMQIMNPALPGALVSHGVFCTSKAFTLHSLDCCAHTNEINLTLASTHRKLLDMHHFFYQTTIGQTIC